MDKDRGYDLVKRYYGHSPLVTRFKAVMMLVMGLQCSAQSWAPDGKTGRKTIPIRPGARKLLLGNIGDRFPIQLMICLQSS